MAKKVYLTKGKMMELQEELHDLKTRGRKEMAEKIAYARSHGDLSENADYDAAKDEQGLMELRISKLEQILANVHVISPEDFPNDKIYILSQVTLFNRKTQKEVKYLLVGEEEADYEQNKIAVSSPIGRALMGRKQGETVTMTIPAGDVEYDILEVTR